MARSVRGNTETAVRTAGRAAELDQTGIYASIPQVVTEIAGHLDGGTVVPAETWDDLLAAVGPGPVAAVVDQLRSSAS